MGSAARKIEQSGKRVLVRGTLFTPDGAFNVLVRDVSPTGALISSKDRVPPRCDVILKRGPIFVAGHVASTNETGASPIPPRSGRTSASGPMSWTSTPNSRQASSAPGMATAAPKSPPTASTATRMRARS